MAREKPKSVDQHIQELTEDRAIFCLRALMITGKVSEYTMMKVIELAESIQHDRA